LVVRRYQSVDESPASSYLIELTVGSAGTIKTGSKRGSLPFWLNFGTTSKLGMKYLPSSECPYINSISSTEVPQTSKMSFSKNVILQQAQENNQKFKIDPFIHIVEYLYVAYRPRITWNHLETPGSNSVFVRLINNLYII